jgi:hypothetical protein
MRAVLLSILVLLALAAPASAGTTNCVAPPGTAAIEEYCETVPSATGNGGGGASATRPVSSSTRAALRSQGADGQALAGLLRSDGNGTAAAPAGGSKASGQGSSAKGASSSRGTVDGASASQDEPSSNPLHAVTSAVQAGPTLGGGLIWGLLGITALMLAAAWLRLRARRD